MCQRGRRAPYMSVNKVKAAMHHVIDYAQANSLKMGFTQLLKILLVTDLVALYKDRRTVTGATFVKGPYGPVPDNYDEVKIELLREGAISVKTPTYPFQGVTFTSLAKPKEGEFPAGDIALLNDVTDEVCKLSARQISDLTHNKYWQLAGIGEEIPLAAYLPRINYHATPDELERARNEFKGLGHAFAD